MMIVLRITRSPARRFCEARCLLRRLLGKGNGKTSNNTVAAGTNKPSTTTPINESEPKAEAKSEAEKEPNESVEGATGYGSVIATSVAGAETAVNAGSKGVDAIKLLEETEQIFSRFTKSVAVLDMVNSGVKVANHQISKVHAVVNTVADIATFFGFPEVTLAWGMIDMGLEAAGVKW